MDYRDQYYNDDNNSVDEYYSDREEYCGRYPEREEYERYPKREECGCHNKKCEEIDRCYVCRGPRGPQGPCGPRGPRGPRGPVGPCGPCGPCGPRGPMGPMGPCGPRGPQGPGGPQGPRGPQGPCGPRGQQGAQGDTGATGPRGLTGAVGPQGPIGPQGPKGDTGAAGTFDNFGVVYREVSDPGLAVMNGENVALTSNDIVGNSIQHQNNARRIFLQGNASYLVKYSVSFNSRNEEENCGCRKNYCDDNNNNNGRDVSFALSYGNGNIIPGTQHFASVSNDVRQNHVASYAILNLTEDRYVSLTNLTQGNPINVNSATISIIKLR